MLKILRSNKKNCAKEKVKQLPGKQTAQREDNSTHVEPVGGGRTLLEVKSLQCQLRIINPRLFPQSGSATAFP